MKNCFLRVFALGLWVFASLPTEAQPPDVAPPQPQKAPALNLNQSNADALALIGAFFNKMSRARSYRGHMITTKTRVKEGKVVSKRTSEIESSWIGDAKREGTFSKNFTNIIYTVTLGDKTTVEKLRGVDDGTKSYHFYGTKNVWNERNQNPTDTAFPLALTRATWMFGLLSVGAGNQFKTERKDIGGQEQILVSSPGLQYIFEARSGHLQSVTVSNPDETTEFRWLQTEFDVPLPDSTFQWQVPEGATQVAPESVKVNIQF